MRSKWCFILLVFLFNGVSLTASAQDSEELKSDEPPPPVNEMLKTRMLGDGPLKGIFDEQREGEGLDKTREVDIKVGPEAKTLAFSVATSDWYRRDAVDKISDAKKEIAACANEALSGRSEPGIIVLEMKLDAKGAIEDAQVKTNELGEAMAACLNKTLVETSYSASDNVERPAWLVVYAEWRPSDKASAEEKSGEGSD